MIGPGGLAAGLLASLGGYLGVALALIASQRPRAPGGECALDFDALAAPATGAPPAMRTVLARDGTPLGVRSYEKRGAAGPLLVLVHGSGWHGGGYQDLAAGIAASGVAQVTVPDLRGHGAHPRRRGDLDYIGQLEDDLHDVIQAFGGASRKVFMLGHSSGGGLVVRFAGGRYAGTLSKAVLMAPFLAHDAPVTRRNSGGWARPLVRRIIGLSMLNKIGISALNGLKVIGFAFPPAVLAGPQGATATPAYSYRMNVSFAPRRRYLADVAALPEFCVITGADDAAFAAEAYEPLMAPVNPRGVYRVLPGVGHLGIIRSPQAAQTAIAFLKG